MEKDLVDLSKYLVVDDWSQKAKVLDGPEDIAEAEAINKGMRKVVQEYRSRATLSWHKARRMILDRSC